MRGFIFWFKRYVLERYRNKPKIILEHFTNNGYIIKDKDWCQINLGIKNKGTITAKNINVKIESIIQDNTNKIPKSNIFLHLITIEKLQSEDYTFIPIIIVTRDNDLIEIPRHRFKFERKNFDITFFVTGDNIISFRKSFEYIDSTDHNKVKFLAS